MASLISIAHKGVSEASYVGYRLLSTFSGSIRANAERFALGSWPRIYASTDRPIWIHAASVGEVRGILPLLEKLGNDVEIVGSTTSHTGLVEFRKHVKHAALLPFDAPSVMNAHLDSLNPQLIVINETELWPALLQSAFCREIPILLINARISNKSFPRYRMISGLTKQMLSCISKVLAQTPRDVERFCELGAEPETVVLAGLTKYDVHAQVVTFNQRAQMREAAGFRTEVPYFIAGSVRKGEYSQVIEAFQIVRRDVANLRMIIAPRHPEYFDEVALALEKAGIDFIRSSQGRGVDADVLLLDTMGELNGMYPLANVAFVGGTLVPIGGHNPLEASAAGLPVIFGPHTENVAELAAELCREGAASVVEDSNSLALALHNLLVDEKLHLESTQAAYRVCQRYQGAVSLVASEIDSILGRQAGSLARVVNSA